MGETTVVGLSINAVMRRNAPARPVGACALALGVLIAVLAGCAQQRIRSQADQAIERGQYEQAVQTLEAGAAKYPDSATLRSGLIQAKDAVLSRLLAQASTARASSRLTDAQTLLNRALKFDSSGTRVQSLLEDVTRQASVQDALGAAKRLMDKSQHAQALVIVAAALKESPNDPELAAMQRQLELHERQRNFSGGRLSLEEGRTISLDFRDASLRTVLDVVSRNSGINFIFDKDLQPDSRVTVLLRNAKVEDAIDLITSTHQLAKKVVDRRTILIYANTPEKQREHQEQIVKVFYLSNAEAKGAASFLKSMLKINDPYVDDRANMLSIRESAENVMMAERLLALYDSQEPEVLMDVEVIEVSSARLTQLGVKFPDAFSLTPLAPNGGSTGLTLGNVKSINSDRIGLSVSGLLVNMKREVGDVNVLANPKIRARNKEKAKIMIGDKIPVVTATVGTGGFVSDSVNYLDVGLKLEVEPTVYVNDEISIKVGLEVSTLGNAVKTSSGTQAYQIGSRNASTSLRLKDGETQLLAGLISREDRTNASRVPGAGDLPLLGRLFSSQEDNTSRTELVLAITPRIIRNQRYPQVTETEMWVGTESQPKFRSPSMSAKMDGTDAVAAVESLGTKELRSTPQVEASTKEATQTSEVLSSAAPPELSLLAPAAAKVGEVIEVTLNLNSGIPVRGGTMQFSYPKNQLVPLEITEGRYFNQNSASTSFTHAIDAGAGLISVGIVRPDDAGTTGQASVFIMKFKPIKAGQAGVTLTSFNGLGLTDKQRPKVPVLVSVDVK